MRARKFYRPWAAVALLAIACAAATVAWQSAARWPKRFAPVVEGQLYRSGAVSPQQLERLQRAYGIRRVLCLLNSNAPETEAERGVAERLGIEWHNVPLPGDGASTPEDRRQILALLSDTNGGPTLVHCAAGTNRTGLAVGLYRLRCQGWSLSQVMEELREFGFEDEPHHGNLREALTIEAAAVQALRSPTTAPVATSP